MDDVARIQFVAEINRLKVAVEKTESNYLRRDYQKAIKRKTVELRQYDRLKAEKP